MCVGVTKGLAFKKFSGSVSKLGNKEVKIIRLINIKIKPKISFEE